MLKFYIKHTYSTLFDKRRGGVYSKNFIFNAESDTCALRKRATFGGYFFKEVTIEKNGKRTFSYTLEIA